MITYKIHFSIVSSHIKDLEKVWPRGQEICGNIPEITSWDSHTRNVISWNFTQDTHLPPEDQLRLIRAKFTEGDIDILKSIKLEKGFQCNVTTTEDESPTLACSLASIDFLSQIGASLDIDIL